MRTPMPRHDQEGRATNRSRGGEITEAHKNAPVPGGTSDLTSLTARQRLALDALLAGGSRAEAADAAGVRPEQVSRWQRHPAFAYALAAAQAAVHAEVCGAVLDLVRSAVIELQRKVDEGDMAAIRLVYERLPSDLLRRAMEPPVDGARRNSPGVLVEIPHL